MVLWLIVCHIFDFVGLVLYLFVCGEMFVYFGFIVGLALFCVCDVCGFV